MRDELRENRSPDTEEQREATDIQELLYARGVIGVPREVMAVQRVEETRAAGLAETRTQIDQAEMAVQGTRTQTQTTQAESAVQGTQTTQAKMAVQGTQTQTTQAETAQETRMQTTQAETEQEMRTQTTQAESQGTAKQELPRIGQIEELEELLPELEPSVFEQMNQPETKKNRSKTLQDSQTYIGILLNELEECKQQLKKEPIPKEEKRNPWKVATLITFVALLLCCLVFFFWYDILRERAVTVDSGGLLQETTPTPLAPTEAAATTWYLNPQLEAVIQALSAEQLEPFTATEASYFGLSFLCLTYQDMELLYRNEFPNGEEAEDMVICRRGNRLVGFEWPYELNGDMTRLIPHVGAFGDTQAEQLLFVREQDSALPILHMIDAVSFLDYGEFVLAEELRALFSCEYEKLPEELISREGAVLKLTVNDVPYSYLIAWEDYLDVEYYEEDKLSFLTQFEIQYEQDGIYFSTVLTFGEEQYLGAVSGKIIPNGRTLSLAEVRFGAYAASDIEDSGSDKLIEPFSAPPAEVVTMNGSSGERYYIPIFDTVARNTRDWEANWRETAEGCYAFYEGEEIVSRKGIDVSRYQGEIEWERVKADGVEFAIIRLGYRGFGQGTLELDPYYFANIKGANEAGVPVGIYFFSQAITTEEAVEEAEMVLRYIADFEVTWPIVFDTEAIPDQDARANQLTQAERTDMVIAFCERIKAEGYTPMVYANTRYMIMGLDLSRLTAYDKWFAYYGTSLTFPYAFEIYQYSDTGTIDGIDGPVDLDISFIDYGAEKTEVGGE